MRISTKIVWDMITDTLLEQESYEYDGLAAWGKGASAEQKSLAAQQNAFYSTLQSQQSQQFANQNALFSSIRAVYDPIFNAGPNQFGFSKEEETALRSQASEGTAANYRQAESATSQALAARGGGNSFLPSGAEADIHARVAGAAAAQESGQQLGITKEGYETGRQNFQRASDAEMGVAAGYNPLGYAGAATNAGKAAFDSATEIQKANAAGSPWGAIGGLLGGVAGSFLTGGVSNLTSGRGFLGNAGSSNKSGSSGNDGWNDATAGF